MPELLKMDPASKLDLVHYPRESRYVQWGMTASIGAHVLFALVVLILAWWNHIHDLRELMTSSIVMTQPPDVIEVVLPPDDTPPPPTDHPLFIKQIIQPLKPPPPPPPKPKPKPQPKQPLIQHVTHAKPGPATANLTVGSDHFPKPDYPFAARSRHTTGTVIMHIEFNGGGKAIIAEVARSSGSSLLDIAAQQKILSSWGDPTFANKTLNVPIIFNLQ